MALKDFFEYGGMIALNVVLALNTLAMTVPKMRLYVHGGYLKKQHVYKMSLLSIIFILLTMTLLMHKIISLEISPLMSNLNTLMVIVFLTIGLINIFSKTTVEKVTGFSLAMAISLAFMV